MAFPAKTKKLCNIDLLTILASKQFFPIKIHHFNPICCEVRATKFSKQELRKMYRGFKQECQLFNSKSNHKDGKYKNGINEEFRSAQTVRSAKTLSRRSLRSFSPTEVSSPLLEKKPKHFLLGLLLLVKTITQKL